MPYKSQEIEDFAIEAVIKYEGEKGWDAKDVSKNKKGYDVQSKHRKTGKTKKIEVKGGAADNKWSNVEVYKSAKEWLKKKKLWIYTVMNVEKAKNNDRHELVNIYITEPHELHFKPITNYKINNLNNTKPEKWRD